MVKKNLFRASIFFILTGLVSPALPSAKSGSEKNGKNYFESLQIVTFKKRIEAADFTLKDLHDKDVSLKDFSGKVILLNFWATWCAPCILEMPSMEKLYRQHKNGGLVILAINLQESPERVRIFMQKLKLTFPALLDSKGHVSSLYGVSVLPTTYLIDRKGKIIGGAIGARNWSKEDAHQMVQSLLEE